MKRHLLPPLYCLVLLVSCKPSGQSPVKAIVGAILIDGAGGPPISDSVVTIEGSRIRATGSRSSLSVPSTAEKIDGSGKFLVPGLIDLDARLESAGPALRQGLYRYLRSGVTSLLVPETTPAAFALRREEREGTLQAARLFLAGQAQNPAEVEALAGRRADAIEVPAQSPSTTEQILDEARKHRLRVLADAATLAGAQAAVDSGAASLLHMICDTDAIDPRFIARLRDLRTVFAPALGGLDPARRAIAARNTKRLADGGVPIGVGSGGATLQEIEYLAETGLSPAEIITAATRNGALALGQAEQLGTIEPGKRADLLLLSANPAEDIRNLKRIDRIMLDGQWIEPVR